MAHQRRTAGNSRHPEVGQEWFTVRFPAPIYRGEGSPYSGSRGERGRPSRDSVGAILNGDCELRHSNAMNDPDAERAILASHEGIPYPSFTARVAVKTVPPMGCECAIGDAIP